MDNASDYLKGRGAQYSTANPYSQITVVQEHPEGLDEPLIWDTETKIFTEYPKTIVNKVTSPDVGMLWSLNPYQGCEHGCIYCYARNTHQYWGHSAGLDFERKLIIKPNAPQLLREWFDKPKWQPATISLSGNTDCYQPIERKYKITRQLLQVFAEYKNPVGIITKNQLVLRDLDILQELAKEKLTGVMITITSLNEELRLKMEPRTATYKARLKVIEQLAAAGIPVGVMVAPIIPGLTIYDIASVIKESAEAGATLAGYTVVRLNGSIEPLFKDWLQKNYPDRFNKVWNQIQSFHQGEVGDSRFGVRMKGEGQIASTIHQLFKAARAKYMPADSGFQFNTTLFKRPGRGQLGLF